MHPRNKHIISRCAQVSLRSTKYIYRVDHKVGQFFFFKESNFQIVRVFCATKIFVLIFDTFKKNKTDQLYGLPYICIVDDFL
jgi:predicted NAD-dependent protein-ADP-ribosyltransferase YbiA (DUF1768 family)